MMCSRNCKCTLTTFDAINILCYSFKQLGNNNMLRMIAMSNLDKNKCNDRELKCYLPLFVYYLRYDDGIIADF